MASSVASSGQTTQFRSIMTLDGYVSRGKAPPNSVPRDHAMLQDFAAYLELRLKSQNLSMLRRIFADFLNEHENTLVPMMHQGCTMITIFPMLRTSARRRRQAEILLAKPKFHLDMRGCVFLYLQYRTATRNMALLKHLFLEFVCHRETSLLAFVERGCQVISVIPFELPQMRLPPRVEQRESPRAVEAVTTQEQGTETVVKKTRNRKRRTPGKDATQKKPSTASTSTTVASVVADAAKSQRVLKEPRKSLRKTAKTRTRAASEVAAVADQPKLATKRQRNRGGGVCNTALPSKADAPLVSSPVAVTTPKRGKKTKTRVVTPLQEAAAIAHREAGVVAPEEAAAAVSSAIVAVPKIITRRRTRGSGSASSKANASKSSNSASSPVAGAVITPKRSKKTKTSVVEQLQEADAVALGEAEATIAPREAEAESVSEGTGAPSVHVEGIRGTPEEATAAVVPEQPSVAVLSEQASSAVAPQQVATVEALKETGAAVAQEKTGTVVASIVSQEPLKLKRGRKRKSENQKQKSGEVKSHKRGKPAMTEEMIQTQLELARKMKSFVAQSPWDAVYGKLSAPFEEEKYPELSKKFHRFWHKHSRAVWERNFWSPASRKLNVSEFHKRNNRQLTAKNAFESLIIAAYKEFGAAFFVKLDTQKPRHPGWWYRGPVVALVALQQLKGEEAMWEYIKNDAFERFPDCKLPLPLASANSAALRRCDKRESESMWMANHPLTVDILREIAILKKSKPCEKTTTVEVNQDLGNSITMADPLKFK